MFEFKIFITNSSKDIKLASLIKDTLNRVAEFKSYLSTSYPAAGENPSEKMQNGIEDTNFLICLLTQNSINDQLINQVIGYAYKVKRLRSELKTVILSESNLNLYGLARLDNEDTILIDKYNEELLLHNIIWYLRKNIENGFQSNTFKLKIKCCNCKDLNGQPNEFFGFLPSQNDIKKNYVSGKRSLSYFCPYCGASNDINILTFENISKKTPQMILVEPTLPG